MSVDRKRSKKGPRKVKAAKQGEAPRPPALDLSGVEVAYDAPSDVLSIQFDAAAKRSWSYAYDDFVVIHGGTLDGRPVLQGITLINAKEVRRLALTRRGIEVTDDDLAADFDEIPDELAELYRNLAFEVHGSDVVLSDRRRTTNAGMKILEWVTPTIGFVHDLAGRLVAVVMRGAAFAFDRAALKDMFDMFFDALLGPPDADAIDPKRSALGNAIVEVFAPVLAA
jgi:hypothetical protein